MEVVKKLKIHSEHLEVYVACRIDVVTVRMKIVFLRYYPKTCHNFPNTIKR